MLSLTALQVTTLQQLQHLTLYALPAAAISDSMGIVERLAPSVHSLLLNGHLAAVPAQLTALAGQLGTLRLESNALHAVETGAISGLTNLTCLTLHARHSFSSAPGLQLLSRLRMLGVCNGSCKSVQTVPPPAQPVLRSLPAGGWMSNLTHLALSYDVLFGSLSVLPAATRLQSLSILRLQCMPAAPPVGEPHPHWDALCDWLCTHAPLRRLTLVCFGSVYVEVLEMVLVLAHRRPSLLVERQRSAHGFLPSTFTM